MQEDLNVALEHHRRGSLSQAAQAYESILARDPNHADAWHLLGLVAHQRGDHVQAVERIGRAIAIQPGAAHFHSNLAEAYRALGQFDRAIGCCRLALRLQPDCAEAANHFGLALLAQGKIEPAAAQFREALRLRPDFAMVHNNLATALLVLKDKAQAIAHFRQAVQLDPTLAEAHSNLGQLLLEHKELPEALVHCQEAARLCPNLPEAQNNLGNVLRELERLPEAKSCYAEALRLNPDLAMAYNNMGQAVQQDGKLDDALTWYQQALQLEPNSARIHCNLASALEEQERYEEASARYELALQLDPTYAEAHNGLGFVRHEQGRYEEAKTHYRQAIQLKPDFARAHSNLGTVLEELNALDEAESCFHEALRHEPRQAGAYGQLATLLRGKLPAADLDAMKRLLADPHMGDGQRMALHYGLAQALDGQGAYEQAAAHLQEANALCLVALRKRGQDYDPAVHTQFVSSLIATLTPEFFARVRDFGLETERPIFIIGLPRSGTTLTEQILASHSQVFGAGELRFAGESFESMPKEMNSDAPAIECLSRIDRETAQRVAQHHLERLRERNASAPRIVDKMPDNYLHLGLITTLFPRARIIHCRRELRDIAVSCWMTHFRHIRWACDLEHIAARFHEYQRVMDHWRQVLPTPLLEIEYEDTVADLEGVARRLVSACGLEWEPACLAFHESRRPVRTASLTQVRQPIYTRSVARWKNYEKALAPLFARL